MNESVENEIAVYSVYSLQEKFGVYGDESYAYNISYRKLLQITQNEITEYVYGAGHQLFIKQFQP